MAAKKKPISLSACLAHTLRTIRESRNLSQSALARLAEIGQPSISDIESGARGASFAMIATLGKALKVDPRELLREPTNAP